MKVAAIVQARMGSTRLPGKVLKDLAGEPVLTRVLRRLSRASSIDSLTVATSTESQDDCLETFCHQQNWPCFRGSLHDVLDRYYQAACAQKAEAIVRITSDCPLLDPEIVDLVVQTFCRSSSWDYVSNTLPPRTYPRGLDVEVFSFTALEHAWKQSTGSAYREHVTPYLYQHPQSFRLHPITHEIDLSSHRWTLDTPQDLCLLRHIYDHFGTDTFHWSDVLLLLEKHPEWLALNHHVPQKKWRFLPHKSKPLA